MIIVGAKISWKSVFLNVKELNLKRVDYLNKAAIMKDIWNLFIQASSISVALVKSDFIEWDKSSGCDISPGQHWV